MTHLIIGISAGFTIGFIAAMWRYEDLHKKYVRTLKEQQDLIDLQNETMTAMNLLRSTEVKVEVNKIFKEVNLN